MFTTTLMGHYIPLTWLSLGVNYALGGMDPWGYHLGNLLLHAANAGVFFLVARRLLAAGFATRDVSVLAGAALAALVFGVHPLRAESVAWVTERRDVLCGLFYLLAVLAYLRGTEGEGAIRPGWRALSLLAFLAALLSKAMAMTLPATLLLLDLYPLRRTGLGWKALLREKAPYAGLGLVGAAAAVLALSRGATVTGYGEYGPAARVALVGYSLWFYPRAMLWPVGLSPLYEIPGSANLVEWRFLGPMVAVALTTAMLVALRRRWPPGLAAWAHSAIVLLPVSGIVHAGYQLAHDRYSYLSGPGFAVLAGAGLVWTARAARAGRVAGWVARSLAVAAALVVLGWGAGAWRQTRIWQSSESLWQAALAADPECALCNNNMGAAIVRSDRAGPARLRLAEAHFRYAILLRPERGDPYHNLGALLAGQKRYHEAEWALRTYIRLSPAAPDGPLRLGMLYADQGRHAEAIESLDRALRLRAEYPEARAERSRALSGLRETDPALAETLTSGR
ncbi:MAG: hypothetical protein HYV93_06970 [Candidatus Rokubacteria bacterium]|nr:hypothetical protein [Candidatus Rokubacteria bacterium]